MGNDKKRTHPLWLRVLVALPLSCVLAILAFVLIGDLIGIASIPLCIGLALVSTVLMARRARRVGTIATWFMEMLSGL